MSESLTRINLQPASHAPGADQQAGYSYGVRTGGMIWVSGQVSRNRQGELVGDGDIEAQVVQVLENVKGILAEGGATLDDVVKTVTYLTDASFRVPFQRIRKQYFKPPNLPASAVVVVKGLVQPELLIEIEAVAILGSARHSGSRD